VHNDFSRIIVVKLGGSIFDARDTTLADMVGLQKAGCKLVIVHGGAKMVTSWCAELGIKSQFHQGERVTDRKSLDVVVAVLAGLANKETVAAITRSGGRAVGLSGADGGMIKGTVRDAALGYIGEVTGVNPEPLTALLAAGFMPVVSPVSYNDTTEDSEPLLLNVNGDTAAGAIAAALGAGKLVYLTDVPGIRGADGNSIETLTPGEAQGLLDSGVAAGGMIPKIKSCLVAGRAGVTCHIVDGRRPHALSEAAAGTAAGTTIAGGTIR
jgi:acetylglutamate kinase